MDSPEERLLKAAELVSTGQSVVRAVIVKTWGSTPREIGADLVIDAGGRLYGTVGGGCGEAEVYELASELLANSGGPSGYLYHVDLTENPEDGGIKICGGRFDVLIQRLEPGAHGGLLKRISSILKEGGQLSLQTSTGGEEPGQWKKGKSLLPISVSLSIGPGNSQGPHWLNTAPSSQDTIFNEPLGKALRLIIVGAGHIARPLCRFASATGYRVTILDDRPEYALKEYFPEAQDVITGSYTEELPKLAAQPRTSVVLVTRGHKHDQECLRLVAEYPLDYLGMIGSQRRIDAVYAELIDGGVSKEALMRVCAPVGVEIGAFTPPEIAISIIAQMIKRRRLPKDTSRSVEDRLRHQKSLHRLAKHPTTS